MAPAPIIAPQTAPAIDPMVSVSPPKENARRRVLMRRNGFIL